jgi:hypothetical protein
MGKRDLSSQEFDEYKGLWEDMEEDFEATLPDAPSEDEFVDNAIEWAGIHAEGKGEVAIKKVAEAIYREKHREAIDVYAVLRVTSTDLNPRQFGARYIRGRSDTTKARYRSFYRRVQRLKQLNYTIRFMRAGQVIAAWEGGWEP